MRLIGKVKLWIFALIIIVLVIGIVFAYFVKRSGVGSLILINAYLPKSFTVNGPYAKLLYSVLGIPYGSLINASALSKPSIRLTWHIDYLTLIMRNGSKIVIEAKTQVIQVKVNGSWLTVEPTFIKPNYVVKVVKGSRLLEVLAGGFHGEAPIVYDIVVKPTHPVLLSAVVLPNLNYSSLTDPLSFNEGSRTWALSAFTNVNDSNSICGYVYFNNGSDLTIPVNDYALAVLTAYQPLYAALTQRNLSNPVFIAVQPVVSIIPPSLVFNVYVVNYTLLAVLIPEPFSLYHGNESSNLAGLLTTGATLCASLNQVNSTFMTITLSVSINGVNTTEATVDEWSNVLGDWFVNVTAGQGFSEVECGLTCNSTIEATELPKSTKPNPTIASAPYSSSIMLYPSLAFETNDNSSFFFSNNTGFALIFQLGNEPSSVGYWPLFYSISSDISTCPNIWGSSGVGTMWPPNSGNGLWGASGLTIEYSGELTSYKAIIGSLSQMKNNAIMNTVNITCSYVDTELSALNMKS